MRIINIQYVLVNYFLDVLSWQHTVGNCKRQFFATKVGTAFLFRGGLYLLCQPLLLNLAILKILINRTADNARSDFRDSNTTVHCTESATRRNSKMEADQGKRMRDILEENALFPFPRTDLTKPQFNGT